MSNIVILTGSAHKNSDVADSFALGLKSLSEFKTGRCDVRRGDKLSQYEGYINKDDIEKARIYALGENYDKNLLFGGKVFLLTSHATFSSALLFAEMFQDNHLATVVGEIPGNSPECFGNITKFFPTPNGNLEFRTTSRKFYRIDKSKDGKRLTPDVQVSAKDALNKVYEIID